MLKVVIIGTFMVLSSASAYAMAKDGCGGNCNSCHSLTEKEANVLLKGLGTVKSVKQAPVRGLFELQLEKDGDRATAYVDYGKKNLIAGQIFNIASREPITPKPAEQMPKVEKIDLNKIPLENSLVMGNAKGTKKLIVFTDPDCPFCSKLHAELKKLVELDKSIIIHIKMLPLKMHPKAYDKARVILGRKSLQLLDSAFSGGALPAPGNNDSPKPVDDAIRLAESLGISSTPTIILPNGKVLPGFKDLTALQKLLGQDQ